MKRERVREREGKKEDGKSGPLERNYFNKMTFTQSSVGLICRNLFSLIRGHIRVSISKIHVSSLPQDPLPLFVVSQM